MTTWIVPTASGGDGSLDQAEAFPTIVPYDPFSPFDADGDGIQDILLLDYSGTSNIVIFSGADLDHLGLTPADAVWTFDGQSTGRTGNGAPLVVSDADGDGYPDLVGISITEPYISDLYHMAGLLSGTVGWEDISTDLLFAEACLGADVAVVGDLDEDGIDDFAVSVVPEESASPGRPGPRTDGVPATGVRDAMRLRPARWRVSYIGRRVAPAGTVPPGSPPGSERCAAIVAAVNLTAAKRSALEFDQSPGTRARPGEYPAFHRGRDPTTGRSVKFDPTSIWNGQIRPDYAPDAQGHSSRQ